MKRNEGEKVKYASEKVPRNEWESESGSEWGNEWGNEWKTKWMRMRMNALVDELGFGSVSWRLHFHLKCLFVFWFFFLFEFIELEWRVGESGVGGDFLYFLRISSGSSARRRSCLQSGSSRKWGTHRHHLGLVSHLHDYYFWHHSLTILGIIF